LTDRGGLMAYIDDPETQRANIAFIKASMKEPLLSRDHEFELAQRWRDEGDEPALHELVRAYTRLVVATASRFRNYGLPMGDLVQEGNVGLMQAAARFEPGREVRFSTYAAWWIRSAMQDYILRNWSIVRTGTTAAQKSLFFNLRRLRAKIDDVSGRPLSPEGKAKIARELRVEVADVEAMEMRLGASDQSLNAPVGDGAEDDWQDFLADTRPSPEEVVIGLRDNHTRSRWLADALGELSARERIIINQRRLRDEGATLEELGRELGVSKERVRQLEHRAMLKLRESMRRHIERPADLFLEAG
jgi:RNA polymerase sigma-32 factor